MTRWADGTGGDASASASVSADEDMTVDDDDEYEEAEGGNRLLGFMFGNVDNSGDLDVDYLDEDAKEHLSALADKLGTSLADIDLSVKSPQTPSDTTDQDYDKKAENAVDYEDIDEQYEGPEVQTATEEDFLLPKKDFFSKEVSVTSLENTTSVFDDENYDDEDEDLEKQNLAGEANIEAQQFSPSGEESYNHELLSQEESLPDDIHAPEMENSDVVDSEEDDSNASEESTDGDMSSLLPVLYVEDGKAILRFSEIFGVHEPLKKAGKRDCRYMIAKEKYKSMDASDVVEEDEEKFMKAPCQDISWMRPVHRKTEDFTLDVEGDSMKPETVRGSGKKSLGVDESRKDSCVSAEPMKDYLSVSAFPEWTSLFSPKFYPLDQEDWEDRIVWNNSPPADNFVESCELSGPDSDTLVDKEVDLKAEAQIFEPEIESEPHDKDQVSFLNNCAVLVEPFSSNECSQSTSLTISESRSHPQLLRLESQLDKYTSLEGVKDVATETKLCSDAIRRFSELTLQNRDVTEGSWLDNIVWEPHQSIAKPKLILDLQDEQMLFELSDMKDGKHLELHAGAMIVDRSLHRSGGDSVDLHNHGILSAGRFNISNDKFYSNRKSSQQLRSHSKKRTVHGLKVLHSIPALKLQTMKAKLSNKDIANFHRPKASWYPHDIEVPFKEQGKLATHGPMKIIMKSLGGKGSKLHVDAEETIASLKAKASKKLDFKLSEPVKIFYSGRELEDDKSIAEQNVHPNSVLHLIRTKIHPLPRAQKASWREQVSASSWGI
ncbi:Transcription initiation factor TFIID subunit [Sesamum alatum]|uniref:Transcription initiation factor TFIID subunit n=1 Tax=Sesamum alatum TaxID=300844 RepID=A0AAE2CXB8_9LAMI|nr:Transcription initiation factor TFIID subunit [Sesamum alatum]